MVAFLYDLSYIYNLYIYIAKYFLILTINGNNSLYYNIIIYKFNPLNTIIIFKILI